MTEGIMRSFLEPASAAVECAPDGSAAIARIRNGTSDHVLVEARSSAIDGMSGIAALLSVVEAGKAAGIPITLLVAPSDEYPLGEIASLQATNLVLKPVGSLQLVAALQSVYDVPEVTLPQVNAA